jgi:hypothetical protein
VAYVQSTFFVSTNTGHGAQEQRLEHGAFLSLWLVHFVLLTVLSDSDSGSDILPWECLPIVVCLACGHSVRARVPLPLCLGQANGGALGLGTIARPAMSEDYT